MDGPFYSGVDIQVLLRILQHITHDRRQPLRGRCDATFVFITGDAGTGKTRLQDGFRYLDDIRPIYVGSTNIAGREQNRVMSDNQMFVNDHRSMYTTFKHLLNINPKIHARALRILFGNQPDRVLQGQFDDAASFYEAIWPAMKDCCHYLLTRGGYQENNKFITPKDYQKIRKIVSIDNPELRGDVRGLHNETMRHVMAVYPRNAVYDHLVFDTIVFDEAGRISCSWALINVAMYYYIHEWFNTGMVKPTIVIVGSCTQSTVINDTCMEGCGKEKCEHDSIPLNDYSMITMIVKECLIYQDGLMVRHNKYNRRMKTGDIERSAHLATLCNCLELGEHIPESVLDFIIKNMTVSKEEFYSRNCIHLCVTHDECYECLQALDKTMTKDDIILADECMIAAGDVGPDTLYRCSAPAGAMYKSANYLNKGWTKKLIAQPLSIGARILFGLCDKQNNVIEADPVTEADPGPSEPKKASHTFSETSHRPKRFSCFMNKRVLYRGRPYTTTHSARATLVSITGSWEELLRDLMVLESLYVESPEFIVHIIGAISSSLQYTFGSDSEFVDEITQRVSENSTLEDLLHTLYDLRCVLMKAVTDRTRRREEDGNKDALQNDDPVYGKNWFKDVVYTVPLDDMPFFIIPKGETVYVEGRMRKHPRSPIKVRLGKTMGVNLMMMSLKVDQAITDYSDQPFEKFARQDRKKRSRTGESSDKVSADGMLVSVDSYSDDFSDDEVDNNPGCSMSSLSARMHINSGETEPAPVPLFNVTDDAYTALELFPIKLSVVGTVAAHQGMTLKTLTYVKVNKNVSAYNLIVMLTRCSSADELYLYLADGVTSSQNDIKSSTLFITPLDDITADTIRRLVSKSILFTGTI